MACIVEVLRGDVMIADGFGDVCPNCKDAQMPRYKDKSTTGRACAACGYVEERIDAPVVSSPPTQEKPLSMVQLAMKMFNALPRSPLPRMYSIYEEPPI